MIIGGSLVYPAYFSAGLRVVEFSDPFQPREVEYYIPEPTERIKPRLKKVIQTNDDDLAKSRYKRHPGESRGPPRSERGWNYWIPASAGMTDFFEIRLFMSSSMMWIWIIAV